jgi:septum formation protein
MGLAFEVVPPSVNDEQSLLRRDALNESLRELARRKAASVAALRREALVLGTDTVVVVDGEVLGKPRDAADGRRMLQLLSGRSHQVWSGVALVCEAAAFSGSDAAMTTVRFRSIPRAELDAYLASADYLDKAGAYGIQDAAMVFVERIEGCYYNVMGLPVVTTIRLLEQYLHEGKRNVG